MNASKPYAFKKIASTISLLFISIVNAHASDWQISCIAEGGNSVYLIPKDSIKDTGIGTKSAEIITINRDRIDTIEYYKNLETPKKPQNNELFSDTEFTRTVTETSSWDLKVSYLEVDCDIKQSRFSDKESYYYNGKFITHKYPSTNWSKYTEKNVDYEHANVICNRPINYKLINNLKSTSNNLDQVELVTLGRDILKNTSNYYAIQANDSSKNTASLFDVIFKTKH